MFPRFKPIFVTNHVTTYLQVQLAMTTYETVDKHIRRLDTELVRFENELKEKLLSKTGKAAGASSQGVREKRKRDSRKRVDPSAPGGQPGRQRKKFKNPPPQDLVEYVLPIS